MKQQDQEVANGSGPAEAEEKKSPGCMFRLLGAIGAVSAVFFALGIYGLLILLVAAWQTPNSALNVFKWMSLGSALLGFIFPEFVLGFYVGTLLGSAERLFKLVVHLFD